MRSTNLKKQATRIGAIICTIATTSVVHAQADEVPSPAKQKVGEFESRMYQKIRVDNGFDDSLRDSKEIQNAIRDFFAELNSSEMRLEAMGMLDGRYVPLVSREFAAELLGPLVRDADPIVRVRAAQAIAYNRGGARYAKELIALIEGEPSLEALINVALAMGYSGHEAFVPYLERMLNHPDEKVRSQALCSLTELAPMVAFNHNLRLLDDKAHSVRSAAIQNISSPRGNVIVVSLIRMLNDKSYLVREEALKALGELKASSAADAIKELLSDEHYSVRSEAALALGKLRQHAWHVAVLLKDQDVVVGRRAAIAMGLMADSRYIEDLRPLLNDEDSQVREYTVKSIGHLEAVKAGAEQ